MHPFILCRNAKLNRKLSSYTKETMKKAYFITGTDTDVGKTHIAIELIRFFVALGYKTIGMKPISAGCEMVDGVLKNSDALQLIAFSNVDTTYSLVNPFAYAPAIAPHIAANLVNETISIAKIQANFMHLTVLADVVVVEGAGGFCVPINDNETIADLSVILNIPIILVVGMRLGCINHALLSVQAIEAKGLKIAGWIANEIDPEMQFLQKNITSLMMRITAPYLGFVAWQADSTSNQTFNKLDFKAL